jgi:hypothetical protein
MIAAVDQVDNGPNVTAGSVATASGRTIGNWIIGFSTRATLPDFVVNSPNRRINSCFLFELPAP